MKFCFNLKPGGATSGKWSIIKWEGRGVICGYLRLQGGSPTCVDWWQFVVDPWMSIWLCTDRMPNLWGLINWCSSMIVLVGRYPNIPLEMSTGIVYGSPTDSPACGIMWKTCTRERWDPDRPYNVVVKGYHTWPVRGRAYIVLVRFIPLYDWLLIQISATLSNISDSLFTLLTHKKACLLLC
jgi:hypothetical protein